MSTATDTDVLAEVTALAARVLEKEPVEPWKALVDAGLTALAVPEAAGGDGLGADAALAVLVACGRHAVEVPALATVAFGVLPVARWGTPDQHLTVLRPVMERGAVLTAVLGSPSAPMVPAITATRKDGAYRLDGVAVNVPYAEGAHRVLVPALLDGAPGVFLVDPAGLTLERTPASSPNPWYRIGFDAAVADGLLPGGADAVRDLYRSAVAGIAAVTDGLVAGALKLTASYVAQREQFGRPLATFQAVAQHLGDVFIAARTVHLAAGAAAGALGSSDPDAHADIEVAALWAAEQARNAIGTCHHLHGGTGLDLSYPLPRYSAAASDLAHLLGGTQEAETRLGAALFGGDAR